MRHDPHQVTPFGNPRINACLQLSEAYRSLPRPSSPAGAKASTTCPFYLLPLEFLSFGSPCGSPKFVQALRFGFSSQLRLCEIALFFFLCAVVKEPRSQQTFTLITSYTLVGRTGLEPVTPALSRRCSNQLSYMPFFKVTFARRSQAGGGKEIRTPDIQLAKLALYQLSYAPALRGIVMISSKQRPNCALRFFDLHDMICVRAGAFTLRSLPFPARLRPCPLSRGEPLADMTP